MTIKVRILKEAYTKKQKKAMCAWSQQDADRPEGLKKSDAEKQCKEPLKKPKNEEQLEEMSAAGGAGAIQGAVGVNKDARKTPKKEKFFIKLIFIKVECLSQDIQNTHIG